MGVEPLKKFTSIHEVTVEDVLDILDQWERNEIKRVDAFALAEDLYYLDGPGWPDYPRTDQRSVLYAVLESLELMYTNPTLKEDIPALRHFLVIGQDSPVQAWQFIDEYWDSINWDQRMEDEARRRE